MLTFGLKGEGTTTGRVSPSDRSILRSLRTRATLRNNMHGNGETCERFGHFEIEAGLKKAEIARVKRADGAQTPSNLRLGWTVTVIFDAPCLSHDLPEAQCLA
jgi:hypothetical protein